ncbi:MAG: tetratricopeptide repeat protein [Solirubrobacteraceae bacterium]
MALELDPLRESLVAHRRKAAPWKRRYTRNLSQGFLGSVIESLGAPRLSSRLDEERAVIDFNFGVSNAVGGKHLAAISAYERAAGSAHHEVAAKAAFNLGVMHTELGDHAEAAEAFARAAASEHSDVAPKAAFNLGVLLTACGSLGTAAEAFELAARLGHDDVVLHAASRLAKTRWELLKLSFAGPSAPDPLETRTSAD